jgi:hypothetical protein
VDSRAVRGYFQKKTIVWSNDAERMSVALFLDGEVKPYIAVEPGTYVGLWGVTGQTLKEHLDIMGHEGGAFHITDVVNELQDRIVWRIEDIEPGRHYRLEVEAKTEMPGNLRGHLILKTDHPRKPEITIILNGEIKEQ